MKILFLLLWVTWEAAAGTFRVATYNLEFYVDTSTLGTAPKSAQARALIRRALQLANADVVALQEVGSLSALAELRESLQKEDLRYPYWEYLQAADTNLHLAFLSRFPITERRSHTNEYFLLRGKRIPVLRGFGEIEVAPRSDLRVTLMTAHLKSKRPSPEAHHQDWREEEAKLLREKVDAFFQRTPKGHLIVLGDLNDSISTPTLRHVLGRGRHRLRDLRPHERNGDTLPNSDPRLDPRRITWTHYYAKDELYSRIDYILISSSLLEYLRPEESHIIAFPDWGAASDHRPLVATFEF